MELQTKETATMSDEQIVELYWQRDEQAIKETDIHGMYLKGTIDGNNVRVVSVSIITD